MSSTKTGQAEVAGVIGFFEGPDALLEAARKTRESGIGSFDVYTPFPVHGMDEAQGLKRSPIPYVTFVAGVTGFAAAYGLQMWTSSIDWAINVGGKPFNSVPAWVPILFECTVLFAGIATLLAMIFFNRFPNTSKKIFDPGITRDRFALVIEAPPAPKSDNQEFIGDVRPEDREPEAKSVFQETQAQEFLRKLGASDVRTVYAEGWF